MGLSTILTTLLTINTFTSPDLCAQVYTDSTGQPYTDAIGQTWARYCEWTGPQAPVLDLEVCCMFSPSLETLRKLCLGLDLQLSTLFESFELGARNESRELADLLAFRSPRELIVATRVLRALFEEVDTIPEDDSD